MKKQFCVHPKFFLSTLHGKTQHQTMYPFSHRADHPKATFYVLCVHSIHVPDSVDGVWPDLKMYLSSSSGIYIYKLLKTDWRLSCVWCTRRKYIPVIEGRPVRRHKKTWRWCVVEDMTRMCVGEETMYNHRKQHKLQTCLKQRKTHGLLEEASISIAQKLPLVKG